MDLGITVKVNAVLLHDGLFDNQLLLSACGMK